MKIQPLRAFKSTIGLRTMGQFAAMALLPLAAIAALLYAQGVLTPAIVEALELTAGGAAAVALGAGVLQGEAFVRRIDGLIASTRRIAKQDFSTMVPQEGSDEVTQLSRAFNDMARNLGTTLSVQGILAQMDDAILTKLDVGALIRSALRCMRHVTQADVVVLGLFESDAAESMRVFVMQKGERSRIDSEKLEMRSELKRRIPLTPTSETRSESPFPEAFEARLREQNGTGNFYAVPISRGSRAWGVMVSCHTAPVQLNSGQIKLLSGVSTRLIAGFSGSERDQKLHSLAYVDPLTGLPNRVAMQSLLDQQLGNAQRSKTMAAILFIDLDRFKQANDTHGHAFGDRLLIQAANRIRNNVREDDVVARIGGDEFTVILPDVKNPREAGSVARKLIQSLSRRFEIDGHTIYTGASVGIAMYPDDGVRGPELLKMADTAMYRAKSAGRSRFAFYEEPMNAESKRRTVLDGELRNALERSELVLHYQPQIDLKTGALCGVEALVRWQHPSRGLLYPRDFIEYAEEIGLIPEIGGWVMAEACRQFQQWREDGVRVPRVSVNVSNGQLPRTNFVPTVQQLIAKTNMPPGSLEIEVTESMLVEGGKPAIEALNQLSKDGVLIAIDDFGTGYSSFSYLKTMPAQVLKLDMSFLVDAREDNDAGKIVAAIINMAHALQKEVVAEGIERVDQLKLLKTLGCERGQGYLFGKGVPAENIARTFRKLVEPELPAPRLPPAGAAPAAPAEAPAQAHTPTAEVPLPVAPAEAGIELPSPETVAAATLSEDAVEPGAGSGAGDSAGNGAGNGTDNDAGYPALPSIDAAVPAEPLELMSDDAEQAIADLVGAQSAAYPAHAAAPAAEDDTAEIALDFAADHAVSYAAEFAETLAAHRAAEDAILPSVEFPAIAPALPGESGVPSAETADAHANTWPPIDDLGALQTGLSLDDAGAPLVPAATALRLQEVQTPAHH
jgi:diguanylate cyclase (GGDEF)-like protein